ncbi:hypothetical protein [Pseudalgibacter alginicilyticus]|nr:hypothetical protein [Pseudalgibacter alginicilyticus]
MVWSAKMRSFGREYQSSNDPHILFLWEEGYPASNSYPEAA